MGFFNKLLKGLGFEEENEPKQVKEKVKKDKVKQNVYASYELNKVIEEKPSVLEQQVELSQTQEDVNYTQSEGVLDIVKVKSQVEVQMVVNRIKKGENILLNLSEMSSADIKRSLDFLTGAVFALNRTIQKVDGNVYLIQ